MKEPSENTLEQSALKPYEDYYSEVFKYISETDFNPTFLTDEEYVRAIASPSTVIWNGIPSLIGLNDAATRIDSPRCLSLAAGISSTNQENIYFAAVPGNMISANLESVWNEVPSPAEESVIFTSLDTSNEDSVQKLRVELEKFGASVHVFEHPKLRTQASLNFFELTTFLAPGHPAQDQCSIIEALDKKRVPDAKTVGGATVQIKKGSSVEDNRLSELWKLFSTRFGGISDNLPISLEESEENTRALLSDSRQVLIYEIDASGSLTACLVVTDNKQAYPWINSDFLKSRDSLLRSSTGVEPFGIFISGIAALRNGKGSSGARNVLDRLPELVAPTGHKVVSVRFECTDVSSRYVPDLSIGAVKRSPDCQNSSIELVAQKTFVAIKLPTIRPSV